MKYVPRNRPNFFKANLLAKCYNFNRTNILMYLCLQAAGSFHKVTDDHTLYKMGYTRCSFSKSSCKVMANFPGLTLQMKKHIEGSRTWCTHDSLNHFFSSFWSLSFSQRVLFSGGRMQEPAAPGWSGLPLCSNTVNFPNNSPFPIFGITPIPSVLALT